MLIWKALEKLRSIGESDRGRYFDSPESPAVVSDGVTDAAVSGTDVSGGPAGFRSLQPNENGRINDTDSSKLAAQSERRDIFWPGERDRLM